MSFSSISITTLRGGAMFCLSCLLLAGTLAAQDPGAPPQGLNGGNQAPGAGGEPDESHIFFEMGFSYWLQGRTDLARRNFERALEAGGDHSDRNRIALVRLIGREKRAAGASRLEEIRAILNAVAQPELIGTAWLAAMEALYDYGERDAALALALEMPRRYPDSSEADEAVLVSARILFERQRRAAALDQLFFLIRNHGDSDHLDEAHYLLARVYLDPGIYYSPARARTALEPFRTSMTLGPAVTASPDGDLFGNRANANAGNSSVGAYNARKRVFMNSIWRGPALRLLNTLSP